MNNLLQNADMNWNPWSKQCLMASHGTCIKVSRYVHLSQSWWLEQNTSSLWIDKLEQDYN